MTTTYTLYDDPVLYDASIRYDGVVTTPDPVGGVVVTGNRHSAIWRPQRGRSNVRPLTLPKSTGVAYKFTPVIPPAPEITPSRAIQKVIEAPSNEAAVAEVVAFVRDKEMRQRAQPELPKTETVAPPPIMPAPKLATETIVEQSAHHERVRVEKDRKRRIADDEEAMQILSLLEVF